MSLIGHHPGPFLTFRPPLSTILCKFAHKFFFRVSPPWKVSPGAVRLPSDATDYARVNVSDGSCMFSNNESYRNSKTSLSISVVIELLVSVILV